MSGAFTTSDPGSGFEYSMIIRETGITWGDPNANDPALADPTNQVACGGAFSDKEFNPMRAIDKYGNEFTH